jgi:drug/metabolite transporter (DMT)-like permease
VTGFVFAVVLVSAVSHAIWNLIAKGSRGDALLRSAAIMIGAGVTALPLLAATGLPETASLPYLLGSALVHTSYMLLIGIVYRKADMSAAYPILRGGALVMSALLAALLLGDILPPVAWAGVAMVAAGILIASADALKKKGIDGRTLGAAAIAALTVTGYTLLDGAGVRLSGNALGYVFALMGATAIVFIAVMTKMGRMSELASAENCRLGLVGGVLFNISYGAAVWAMAQAPIGLVGAVRETSILFGAAFAALFLGEKFGRWRWIAAIVIVAGLALTRIARG